MSTQNHEVFANATTPLFLQNPALSITLSPTTGSSNVVLTNSNGQLYQNGVFIGDAALWSTFPATSNTIKMDASNTITNVGNNLYYNGSLIANASDISNIADWSLYNAVSDVNLSNLTSNYSIVGARNITALSNVSAGTLTSSGAVSGTTGTFTTQVVSPVVISSSNLSVSATNNLTQYCGATLSNNAPTINQSYNNSINLLGNKGIDYTDFCYTNISNTGGKGGSINLTADAGKVTISGTDYGIGGQINITANSPLIFPYNLTSAIKLSAASVLSYAGAVSPVGSLAGYNYIQGTLGVNIIAGTASSVPNTAGTIYLYGATGTKIQNALYVDTIINYPSSNLNIHPDGSQWTDMTRVQYIGMGNNPVIDGGGGSTSYIRNFQGISATTMAASSLSNTADLALSSALSNINLSVPSGRTINMTGNVSIASGNLNMNSNAISNVSTLTLASLGSINGNGGSISNVATLTLASGGAISNANTISVVTTLLGSNLTISTGGNLTLNSTTAPSGKVVLSNTDFDATSNSVSNVRGFTRILGSTALAQPITQYGSNNSGTGNSGNVTITIPAAYTSVSSYNVFVTHNNSSPPNVSAVNVSSNSFTIYWTNAGAGTQPFSWMTIGT
jgi:hypothetical protein